MLGWVMLGCLGLGCGRVEDPVVSLFNFSIRSKREKKMSVIKREKQNHKKHNF